MLLCAVSHSSIVLHSSVYGQICTNLFCASKGLSVSPSASSGCFVVVIKYIVCVCSNDWRFQLRQNILSLIKNTLKQALHLLWNHLLHISALQPHLHYITPKEAHYHRLFEVCKLIRWPETTGIMAKLNRLERLTMITVLLKGLSKTILLSEMGSAILQCTCKTWFYIFVKTSQHPVTCIRSVSHEVNLLDEFSLLAWS